MSYLSNSIPQNVADPIWREKQRTELLKRDAQRRRTNAPIGSAPPLSDIPIYFEDVETEPDLEPTPIETTPQLSAEDVELQIEDALRLWDKLRADEPATLRLVHERRVAKLTGITTKRMAVIIAEHRPFVTTRPAAYQAEDARRARILRTYRELCLVEPTTPETKHRATVCAKYGIFAATLSRWIHRIKVGKWDELGQPIGDSQ